MSGDDARVAELVAEAQKKIKGGFLGFGGGKYDEAAELYTKAANIYKLAQRGEAAAELFLKAAECANKMNSRHDAANAYINAANCLRKAKPTEAGKLLEQAVTIFAEDGRFGMAAKQQRDLAELYEKEGDLPNAIEAYMKAARLYEGENSQSTANQCLLQAALHSAQLEKYDQAVQLYDQVAVSCLDNRLTLFSFRDYAFRAVLCHLCNDDQVSARKALNKYIGLEANFASSRECKLLEDLLQAIEGFDVEAFTTAVAEFDSMSRLDQWKSSLLLRIKKRIEQQAKPQLV